ncbi:CDGSH iron-sulfur domain-containing protein 3, mitochondrial [Apteryx mantelli]|uniref:CDGSH iron-sulfur domain-containing protein 3, mitochondrial n=1 Tax=Apteryx mantelli TaxID=2696672 RepID=A0ABM4FTM3_9AVES
MALLRPAALVTLMRAAGSASLRRVRAPLGAPPARRCAAAAAEPAIAAKGPFQVELKAGKTYAWCACGHSKKQPFCDGSHKQAAPGIAPLRFTLDAAESARLCGCKRTRSPPYCDGSHERARAQAAPLP